MKKLIFFIIFASFGNIMFGQSETVIWPSIKIDKKINKKLTARFEHETRYNITHNDLARLLNTFEVDYSINKPFNVGLAYTHIYNHNIKKDIYANRHRYYGYVRFKKKYGNFSYSIREKFQSTYYNESVESVKYNPQMALRSKAEISYNFKKLSLSPYLNGQIRNSINNPKGNEIDQVRWSFGTEYKINKKFSVDLYYQREFEVNAKNPEKNDIFGTCLKIKL